MHLIANGVLSQPAVGEQFIKRHSLIKQIVFADHLTLFCINTCSRVAEKHIFEENTGGSRRSQFLGFKEKLMLFAEPQKTPVAAVWRNTLVCKKTKTIGLKDRSTNKTIQPVVLTRAHLKL